MQLAPNNEGGFMARLGKDTWSEAIDRAKDHFNAGWKELGRAAELAKGKGQDSWEEAQEKGRDAWVNAKARGMEMWEDAKSAGADRWSEVRDRGEEWVEDAG